jgi:phage terminase small subunit
MENLTDKEHKFVLAYCNNGEKLQAAAITAGYSPKCAASEASELIRKPKVIKAIDERRKDIAAAACITPEKILRLWWQMATANVNELVSIMRVNCRHCWGHEHAYQWTPAEYKAAIKPKQPAPDFTGGFDFDCRAAPNSHCPECKGAGVERVEVADTRKLSNDALSIYGGVKNGEVIIRSQDAALERIAKYLGMDKTRIDINVVEAKGLDDFYGGGRTIDGEFKSMPERLLDKTGKE